MVNGEDMKVLLDRIETDIAEVKRQYDLFFQGVRRQEPSETRREVEETVRRMGQRRISNSNDQFRFNNLQSRFYSYSNLWIRTVRDLEEGRLVRDRSGLLLRVHAATRTPVDPAHLEKILRELLAARRACGLPAEDADIALARETLLTRARELAEKAGGRIVEFRVSVEEGKPKVKAVLH
ncbi:MAG: hypothetical protein HY896_13685 [Deltaproteobacteria bacterium]|nr:hypothetical protein [Deltaproteobacteria bacterium]